MSAGVARSGSGLGKAAVALRPTPPWLRPATPPSTAKTAASAPPRRNRVGNLRWVSSGPPRDVGLPAQDSHAAELRRHAVAPHHLPRQIGRLLDVVLAAGARLLELQLLRRHPAHGRGELDLELRARQQYAIALVRHDRLPDAS